MGTKYENDLFNTISALISITDNLTDADKTYMENYIGKALRNIQAVVGNARLSTSESIAASATASTTNGSTVITVTDNSFASLTPGDVLTITDAAHADYGNHVVMAVPDANTCRVYTALTETKGSVAVTMGGGAYNLTDAVNDLETRIYRVSDLVVTGTPFSVQTVTFAGLTDNDRGVALPTIIPNAKVIVVPTVDRWMYVVRNSYAPTAANPTSFQIAASMVGSAVGTLYCDLIITSYPN